MELQDKITTILTALVPCIIGILIPALLSACDKNNLYYLKISSHKNKPGYSKNVLLIWTSSDIILTKDDTKMYRPLIIKLPAQATEIKIIYDGHSYPATITELQEKFIHNEIELKQYAVQFERLSFRDGIIIEYILESEQNMEIYIDNTLDFKDIKTTKISFNVWRFFNWINKKISKSIRILIGSLLVRNCAKTTCAKRENMIKYGYDEENR